jgi:LPS sulfotransferase NodH
LNKPNLFLIGAMKSGSTTLHELLAGHHQICMSEPKEPSYFVDQTLLKEMWPEMWQMGFWRSEATYLELFKAKPEAKYRGESSTDYSKFPKVAGVVDRLSAYSPDARIVYIMRDPVERTISHYWHMAEHRGETRPLMDAIQHDPHYTEVSDYAMQLRPYLARFGSEKVKVLTFEELTRKPLPTMHSLFEWLEVDADFVPADTRSARNATPKEVTQRREGGGLLHQLRHSRLWEHIGGYVPPALRRFGVSLVEKKVDRSKTDMAEVIAYLRKLQRPQVDELSHLLGRDFPEWKTLHGH